MNYENLIVNIDQQVALVEINRPKKLNALNKLTISELHQVFTELRADKTVKCIILTGVGEKAFVAGADISEFAHFEVKEGEKLSQIGHDTLFNLVEQTEKPVIAAVNGFALGGGLELALSAHIRIFSSTARVGLPEVSLGLIPGYGGTQRLAQLIGKGRAIELICTAKMIDAQTALSFGLANQVVEQEELIDHAKQLANKIIKNSSTAVSAAIHCVNAHFDKNVDGFQTEIETFGACFATEDFKEGTSAFLEKRKPNFN
ncbi:MAG: enoyl-CoA hydratase-related protein [Flavobacteriales bacterium]